MTSAPASSPHLSGPTFWLGVAVVLIPCVAAIYAWWDTSYPYIEWDCEHCHKHLKHRDPIELNRAIGEHMTAHAAASGPIWNGRKP